MPDRYQTFADLAANEAEGVAYAIHVVERPSPVAILAPHGGRIEPTTSLVATAIAGDRYSSYCFESLEPHRPHGDLHITSTRFDEPRAVDLVARSQVAVAVHGYREQEAPPAVLIGGLDAPLKRLIARELAAAGFSATASGHRFPGTDPANISNRTRRGVGVQLELPLTLRDHFRNDALALRSFAAAMVRAIEAHLRGIG